MAQEPDGCQVRDVLVNASVIDGRQVVGFSKGDFRAKVRGKPIEVLSVELLTVSPRVILLVDTSKSMDETGDKKRQVLL
ncbi:MAG: hypothetical protein ACRD3I_15215, partial [Terriglobales bacterium]